MPRILCVDDHQDSRDVIAALLKTADPRYEIDLAAGADAAMVLIDERAYDVYVLDYMMPEMSGPEFCAKVKSNRKTHLTPILMITSVHGVENEIAGISSGADEFLTKPLHPDVVRARIRAMLR